MHRKWWTLLVVSVATFMLLLDITVVNTALPAIQKDLGATFTELQWVIDAYTLALAALVLSAGVLADRLGRRRVFGAGLAIFTVASALAGLAPDPTFLNVTRAVQGIGGAVMFAVSLALVAQEFKPGRDRGVAMGVYGATIGLAVAFGPLVGGALVEGIGWESIFFLNVPVGIVALVITYTRLAESRDPNASRIDWPGLATFSTALFLLVFGLLRGNDEGWGSTMIVALLAGSGVLLAAFIAIESRVKQPMLPLHLFRKPAFTGVQLAAAAVSASMFALFLYVTFYLQGFLGEEPLDAGLHYLPLTVTNFFVAAGAGSAAVRVQARYILSAGLGLTGLALLLMGGLDASRGLDHAAGRVHPRRRGRGPDQPGDRRRGGVGGAQGARAAWPRGSTTRSARSVSPSASRPGERSSSATEPTRSSRWRRARRRPPVTIPASWWRPSPPATSTRRVASFPAGSHAGVADAAREGFLAGMNQILMLGGILAFAGAVAALWLVREKDIERGEEPLEAEAFEAEAELEPVYA